MATVTPTNQYNVFTWTGIVTGDTVVEAQIGAGTYNMEIVGSPWGGSSAKLLFSLATGPTVGLSQDGVTEFAATADTPVLSIGPLAQGFIKPSVTGGAGNSITVRLSPSSQPETT